MRKLKVGDKVRRINNDGIYINIGEIATIKWIEDDNVGLSEYPNKNKGTYCLPYFELVEEEPKCEPCSGTNGVTTLSGDYSMSGGCTIGVDTAYGSNLTINKKTIMSKITTFAKNLVLSADEKLLRKYGLKDECGEYTSDYVGLVNKKVCQDNEEYVLNIARQMEAEEAKTK